MVDHVYSLSTWEAGGLHNFRASLDFRMRLSQNNKKQSNKASKETKGPVMFRGGLHRHKRPKYERQNNESNRKVSMKVFLIYILGKISHYPQSQNFDRYELRLKLRISVPSSKSDDRRHIWNYYKNFTSNLEYQQETQVRKAKANPIC